MDEHLNNKQFCFPFIFKVSLLKLFHNRRKRSISKMLRLKQNLISLLPGFGNTWKSFLIGCNNLKIWKKLSDWL